MKKQILILILAFCTLTIHLTAQDKVGINTANIDLTHKLTITDTSANVLRLIGPGVDGENFYGQGAKIEFGDLSNRVYISEDKDDRLTLFGLNRLAAISTGNIGIGIQEPLSKVHLEGNTLIRNQLGDALLVIEADSANNNESWNPMIEFRQDGATTKAWLGFDESKLGPNVFGISSLNVDGVFRVSLDGKVGINQVFNNVALNIRAKDATTSFALLNVEDMAGDDKFRVEPDGDVRAFDRMTVGSAAPDQLLTIGQPTDPVVFRLARTDVGRWDYEIVNDAGNLVFRGGADAVGDNLTRHMTINSDGRVGIGTTEDANSNLASGFKLSVNGKIASQEILVDLANAWPDYVFKSDYELMSLEEVENHIEEKGHLPGIPAAAEAESKGIELGEMNRRLLEKIEELTLHTIAQQKQLDAQQKMIVQLLEKAPK